MLMHLDSTLRSFTTSRIVLDSNADCGNTNLNIEPYVSRPFVWSPWSGLGSGVESLCDYEKE